MDIEVAIARIGEEAERVRSFELVAVAGGVLPPFTAGAHIVVKLPEGLARHYSLASDPQDRERYVIAVLREDAGRGGSRWMHEQLRAGDCLTIASPVNRFPLAEQGARHLLIVGGIGITPLLAMARRLTRLAADYTLVYCTRTPAAAAFRPVLEAPPFVSHVRFVHDEGDPRRSLDISQILAAEPAHAHVYCCGPAGMLRAFRKAASAWPAGQVHYEAFGVDPAVPGMAEENHPFTLIVASTGQRIPVPAGMSMLSALERHGIEVPRLCEQGYCGSCLTRVVDGIPDHRDTVQSDAEKATNAYVALCCSRAAGGVLTLDL
ncbi:MAG: PDR/VanB family oxidoreductase [Parvibaculaceae bacterium]